MCLAVLVCEMSSFSSVSCVKPQEHSQYHCLAQPGSSGDSSGKSVPTKGTSWFSAYWYLYGPAQLRGQSSEQKDKYQQQRLAATVGNPPSRQIRDPRKELCTEGQEPGWQERRKKLHPWSVCQCKGGRKHDGGVRWADVGSRGLHQLDFCLWKR